MLRLEKIMLVHNFGCNALSLSDKSDFKELR